MRTKYISAVLFDVSGPPCADQIHIQGTSWSALFLLLCFNLKNRFSNIAFHTIANNLVIYYMTVFT